MRVDFPLPFVYGQEAKPKDAIEGAQSLVRPHLQDRNRKGKADLCRGEAQSVGAGAPLSPLPSDLQKRVSSGVFV